MEAATLRCMNRRPLRAEQEGSTPGTLIMGYRHTQIGSVIIAAIALAIILLLMSFGMKGPVQTIPGAVALILGLALVVFHSLTVEIKDSKLECRLGPGIIKKTFALEEINDARKVRIPWYSGWGIRWIPGQ
jgi:hypothetical protein